MNRREFDNGDECAVPTFGCPMANNGWVQCRSKTFPGKYYYFNVDSRCRTWGRPVSSRVTVPIVNSTKPNPERDDYSDDEIEVSDIEEDDSSLVFAKRRKMFDDIFFKLYHCEPEDEIADVMPVADPSFACKSEFLEEEEDDTKNDFYSVSPEICYSSSSDGESTIDDDTFSRRNGAVHPMRARPLKRSKRSEIVKNYYSRLRGRENRSGGSKDVYDRLVGRLDLFGSRDPIDRQSRNREPLADFAFLSYGQSPFAFLRENDHQEVDEDDDDDDDDSEVYIKTENDEGIDKNKIKREQNTFSLPQLKIIQLSDLMTESPRLEMPVPKKKPKCRVRKVVEASKISIEPPRNKNRRIIAEINGIKTISYDLEDEQLPPGVRASNLSDSESSTFQMAYFDRGRDEAMKKHVKIIEAQAPWRVKHEDELFDIKAPRLSDSSSSGSSSSSSIDRTSTDSSSDSDSSSTSGNTFTKSSSSRSSLTDFSCSTCTSSSSSSTSTTQSLSRAVKKEKSDPAESEQIFREISKIPSNSNKTIKAEAIASPSSSCDGDRTWRPIDKLSDEDD